MSLMVKPFIPTQPEKHIYHWIAEEGGSRGTDFHGNIIYGDWSIAPEGLYDLRDFEVLYTRPRRLGYGAGEESRFYLMAFECHESFGIYYHRGIETQLVVYAVYEQDPVYARYVRRDYMEEWMVEIFKEKLLK